MNMNSENDIPEVERGIPGNSLSVYNAADAMDDFPILKAFQQYVNDEQAKAQKRMTTLCICFVCLMMVVIGVFVSLLVVMSSRNNSLNEQRQTANEQLIATLLADRLTAPQAKSEPILIQQPVVAADSSQQEVSAALSEVKRLLEAQAATSAQAANAARPAALVTPPSSVAEATSKQELALIRQEQEMRQKFEKREAKLKAEREALKKEREALHQKEIELQHRKLYPELFAPKPATEANTSPAPSSPVETKVAITRQEIERQEKEVDAEINDILNDDNQDDDLDKLLDSIKIEKKQTPTGNKESARTSSGFSIPID